MLKRTGVTLAAFVVFHLAVKSGETAALQAPPAETTDWRTALTPVILQPAQPIQFATSFS